MGHFVLFFLKYLRLTFVVFTQAVLGLIILYLLASASSGTSETDGYGWGILIVGGLAVFLLPVALVADMVINIFLYVGKELKQPSQNTEDMLAREQSLLSGEYLKEADRGYVKLDVADSTDPEDTPDSGSS